MGKLSPPIFSTKNNERVDQQFSGAIILAYQKIKKLHNSKFLLSLSDTTRYKQKNSRD